MVGVSRHSYFHPQSCYLVLFIVFHSTVDEIASQAAAAELLDPKQIIAFTLGFVYARTGHEDIASEAAARSAAAAGLTDPKQAAAFTLGFGSASSGPKLEQINKVCKHRPTQASERQVSHAHTQKRTSHART